jgi:hypothetical protein
MKSSLIIFIILFFISLKIFAVPNNVNRSNVTDALSDPTNTFVLIRPNISGTLAITANVLPLSFTETFEPNGLALNNNYMSQTYNFDPLQNSPDESWNILTQQVNLDTLSSGFNFGTNGLAVNLYNLVLNHQGTGDVGQLNYFNTNNSIGNGTDPISVGNISIINGFGNIANNVTLTGQLSGYSFQYNVPSGATLGPSSNYIGFHDAPNIQTAMGPYVSFQSSPQIAEVKNNTQNTGMNLNPTIPLFTGNAGYTGIGVSGTFGATGFGTGGINGINVNQTVTNSDNYYNGIYSSTQNVSGLGNTYAGFFDGKVTVTDKLESGLLNSFYSLNPIIDNGGFGAPNIGHTLVTTMEALASTTTTNADTVGEINVGQLLMGTNAVLTSGPTSLGQLASVNSMTAIMDIGSTTDFVGGSASALNMDSTALGGTIGQGFSHRMTAFPNATTTVTRHYGAWIDQSFGVIGVTNWGIYQEDSEYNYFEGAIKIGVGDVPNASQMLHVTGVSTLDGTITTNMPSGAIIADGSGILSSVDGTNQGEALISDGTNWTSSQISVVFNADDLTLTASDVLSVNTVKEFQIFRVQGNAAAITMSNTPFSGGLMDGTEIVVIGNDNTNTVTFTNNDIAGGCILSAAATLSRFNAITFIYNAALDRYIETSRNF